jgi:hypothetical protein
MDDDSIRGAALAGNNVKPTLKSWPERAMNNGEAEPRVSRNKFGYAFEGRHNPA